ncbi:class I SAM-dependent methyltransferase [bacterium]|nr:class I SAM-dependent methyltransferase [bacterium]
MATSTTIEQKRGDVCPHQFAFMLDNWLRRLVQSPRKIVGEYINEGNTVLDVGCGPGYFTIDMAKMVGKSGKVIAADLQPQMLEKVRKKATKHNVLERLSFHRCEPGNIGLSTNVDFILAFYMIHETGDPKGFLMEMKRMLNPGGKLLIVEPKMHVSEELFKELVRDAENLGLKVVDYPKGKGGRSLLLTV